MEQIETALDTRTIVRYQRALRVFMALNLTKTSRRLINFQRRTTVLDAYDRGEDEVKKIDGE